MSDFKLLIICFTILLASVKFSKSCASHHASVPVPLVAPILDPADVECLSSCTAQMVRSQIVPDVIDVAPQNVAKVTYRTDHSAKGNILTPTWVRDEPNVSYDADPSKFYTVLMTDPDAPSRQNPIRREYRHWLVGNIKESNVGCGETITSYIGSRPPQDTGLHRYVILVFQQSGEIDFSEQKLAMLSDGEGRKKFSTRNFIQKNNLGNPIAGNFFQAEWDSSVPVSG